MADRKEKNLDLDMVEGRQRWRRLIKHSYPVCPVQGAKVWKNYHRHHKALHEGNAATSATGFLSRRKWGAADAFQSANSLSGGVSEIRHVITIEFITRDSPPPPRCEI